MKSHLALFSVGLLASGLDCQLRPGDPATGPGRRAFPAAWVAENFGRLPLHFEANHGQFDPAVRFLARGRASTLYLTDHGAVLAFRGRTAPEDDPKAAWEANYRDPSAGERTGSAQVVVRMKLMGARSQLGMEGLEPLPGISNYFLGNDPAKWRTHVPNYARVRAVGVYPGVDLHYYGNAGRLEYDFVVHPGADPRIIEVAFEGVDDMRLDAHGNLVLETALGEVQWQRPVAYQEESGMRRPVQAAYLLRSGRRVAFQMARYDPTRPLVIDPVLVYSTFLAGNESDWGEAVAADQDGNAYLAGITVSTDYPTTAGVQQPAHGGYMDTCVTKLAPNGSKIIYSTYLGGKTKADDKAYGLALDAAGNVYLTGGTLSDDFPTTANAFQRKKDFGADAFVAKLNPTGSALLYSTYLGGDAFDEAKGIAVDGSGNAWVAGETQSKSFPVVRAVQWSHAGGQRDAFVAKLNSTGSALLFSSYLGGGSEDYAEDIAVDTAGNAYLTGITYSARFPTTPNALRTTLSGVADAFAAALKADGSSLIYSTYLGGSSDDWGKGIAVDASGHAYLTGETHSNDFPTTAQALKPVAKESDWDAYVVKLNPTGSELVYSTYLGGAGDGSTDDGRAIAVDALGFAYVTGKTTAKDFPTTQDAWQREKPSQLFNRDAFLAKLSPSGSSLAYSTYLGGSDLEEGEAVAVDASGSVYVTGWTGSQDFPMHNAVRPNFQGNSWDAWAIKISTVFQPPPGATLEGSTATFAWAPQEGVSGYYLKVGASRDRGDLYEGYEGQNLSVTVAGLPVDGRTIYVRLFCQVGETWKYLDSSYQAGASGAASRAQMISPAPGSTLPGSTITFQWSAGSGVAQYFLFVGSSTNGDDIYKGDQGLGLSATVSGIPTDGRTIYVRLYSRIGEDWQSYDYTYTAPKSAATPAEMTSPAPGSTLTGSTVTFQWSAGSGVDQYYLKVGSTRDAGDLYQKDQARNLSATVSGIPTDGRTIYVWLLSRIGENWHYKDYTYTAQKSAVPAAGFVISNLRLGPVTRFWGDVTLPIFVDFVDPSAKAACDWLERDILLSSDGGSIHSTGKVLTSGVACQTSGTLDLTQEYRYAFFVPGLTVSVKITLTNALGHKSNELTGSFKS